METTHPTRTVEEHRDEVLGLLDPLPAVTLPLADCLGLTLARGLAARLPAPLFTNSSMDGYAVRAGDIASASADRPVALPVRGDVPAGAARHTVLEPGTAVRIMTGAPVPDGADTIVPVEMTDQHRGPHDLPATVRIHRALEPGTFVRRRGEAVEVGNDVMSAGAVVTPAALAAAAAVGYADLEVVPRPRVAIVSTGDELAAPGGTPGLGTIPDSNLVMLAALVRQWGGQVALAVRVPDDPDELRSVVSRAVTSADLVVTSGGISAGAFEVVRQSLESPTVRFVQVAMQPGKPQGFGTLPGGPHGRVALIALPGNPVSSFVSFHVFVRPALERLAGRAPAAANDHLQIRAADAWASPSGRRQYVPVRIDGDEEPYEARLAHRLGSASHLVGSLHLADALAIVPAHVTRVEVGSPLLALPLGPLGPRIGRTAGRPV